MSTQGGAFYDLTWRENDDQDNHRPLSMFWSRELLVTRCDLRKRDLWISILLARSHATRWNKFD